MWTISNLHFNNILGGRHKQNGKLACVIHHIWQQTNKGVHSTEYRGCVSVKHITADEFMLYAVKYCVFGLLHLTVIFGCLQLHTVLYWRLETRVPVSTASQFFLTYVDCCGLHWVSFFKILSHKLSEAIFREYYMYIEHMGTRCKNNCIHMNGKEFELKCETVLCYC